MAVEAAHARDASSDEESSMELSDDDDSKDEDEASQVARAKAFAAALKTSGSTLSHALCNFSRNTIFDQT